MSDYKCAGCGRDIHNYLDDWSCPKCGCVTAEVVRHPEPKENTIPLINPNTVAAQLVEWSERNLTEDDTNA